MHFDGDVPWSRRDEHETTNRFADEKQRVKERVRHAAHVLGCEDEAAWVEARMNKLILMVPYYSIEAWLFQNFRVLRGLVGAEGTADDCQRLEEWEAAPSVLEEIRKVKEELSFGSRHNLDLSQSFPAALVDAVGKSFTAFVNSLRGHEALREALAATHWRQA